ncbi:hypothetical protein H8L32_01735 [Undibacterium sp. CY18W]|uniref:Uncharacterized protein n=1 Tax=Undibacterium hunanense TaxID=2762292 RepID=A0ABR6ZJV3_9BURK|nr:hypothetical protein [Undibacterium hunanense]MBC3916195.1 hypothetical protein [Undibacterium hunanense]
MPHDAIHKIKVLMGLWLTELDVRNDMLPPPGGLKLRHISHDLYGLASLVAADHIFIKTAASTSEVSYPPSNLEWKSLSLGTPEFKLCYFSIGGDHTKPANTKGKQALHKPAVYYNSVENLNLPSKVKEKISKASNAAFPYHNTAVCGHVSAAYILVGPTSALSALKEDEYLVVIQKYLFTNYGKNPPHEPTGTLEAARFFPLIEFHTNCKAIEQIRIDYQLDVGLDFVYDGSASDPSANAISRLKNTTKPTSAGIFRDGEVSYGMSLDALFTGYEKPVKYEICSYGLVKGMPGTLTEDTPPKIAPTTWDNIHFWSSYDRLSSTPGAPHALHSHWRWPVAAQEGRSPMIGLIGAIKGFPSNKEQFTGSVALPGAVLLGWPLIDPCLPNQTIQFAITNRDFVCNPKALSFEDKFMKEVVQKTAESQIDRPPGEIVKENAISFWMSYQASDSDRPKVGGGIIKKPTRAENAPWSGAFFIQGLYLAHSNERADNLFVGTIGVGGQKYDGKELNGTAKWKRTPLGQ